MSKAILMSIRPEWCVLIAAGEKTVEIRKSMPNYVQAPFKVYIYETLGKTIGKTKDHVGLGKVIGEFMCRGIVHDTLSSLVVKEDAERTLAGTCLTKKDLLQYLGYEPMQNIFHEKHYDFFALHISELVLYKHPKALSEFTGLRKTKFGYAPVKITRAPQSWCYVEEQ